LIGVKPVLKQAEIKPIIKQAEIKPVLKKKKAKFILKPALDPELSEEEVYSEYSE